MANCTENTINAICLYFHKTAVIQ